MNLLCEPVKCKLVGTDGNAFALMGRWKNHAQKAGRSASEIKAVLDLAMTADYSHLLTVLASHSK